jgi:hypothetical protein
MKKEDYNALRELTLEFDNWKDALQFIREQSGFGFREAGDFIDNLSLEYPDSKLALHWKNHFPNGWRNTQIGSARGMYSQ